MNKHQGFYYGCMHLVNNMLLIFVLLGSWIISQFEKCHHCTLTLPSISSNNDSFPDRLARSKAVWFWQLTTLGLSLLSINRTCNNKLSLVYVAAICSGVWPPDVCALMSASFCRSTDATSAWSTWIIIQLLSVCFCVGKHKWEILCIYKPGFHLFAVIKSWSPVWNSLDLSCLICMLCALCKLPSLIHPSGKYLYVTFAIEACFHARCWALNNW